MTATTVSIYRFEELTSLQVYQLLQARSAVFVVEQNCAYQDIDGVDTDSIHFLLEDKQGNIMAYCRVIPPEIRGANSPAIGRLIVPPAYRGQAFARHIMQTAIAYCHAYYPSCTIAISAQCYLIEFYQSLGFRACSDTYLEDGIPHIDMLYQTTQ